jgi:hypothetical protein
VKRFPAALLLAAPLFLRAAEEGVSSAAPAVVDGETLAEPPGPVPEGFSGDVRVRLRDVSPLSASFHDAPPSLRHRPYFYQRVRARWGDRVRAGALAVRPVPGPSLAWGDLRRRGVVKGFVEAPGRAVAGDYALSFGQGLLFYDRAGEFVRPAWVQGKGFSGDLGTQPDAALRGAAVRAGGDRWRALAFASRTALDLPLNPDGTAAESPWFLREGSFLLDEDDISARNTVTETLEGLRVEALGGGGRLAATAVRARYAPPVASEPALFSGGTEFRGRRSDAWGLDGALSWDGWRAAADAAFSEGEDRRGRAWAAGLFREEPGAAQWMSVFGYGAGYFARLGKGPAFETSDLPAALPANQRGLALGARVSRDGRYVEGEAVWAHFPAPMGNGDNEDPVFPSQARRWRLEGGFRPAPAWDFSAVLQERARDRYVSPPEGGERRQARETVRKARWESVWSASPRLRLKARADVRWERLPAAGRRAEGKLLMGEARWQGGSWSLSGRWYVFHSPEAFLTTGVEEIWDGVVAPRLAGGMSTLRGASGERMALILRKRWGKTLRVWLKHDADRRWRGPERVPSRRAWHLQTDVNW